MSKLKIHVCEEIRRERRCNSRAFAHVGHLQHAICIAPALLSLPGRFRWAILLHELGHLGLREPHTEAQADRAGGALAGVTVHRANYREARDLECIYSRDVRRARRAVCDLVSWPFV